MADETPPLDDARLAELEAKDVITLAPHACGRANAQLAAYNDGVPDGPITYRVHCHGCQIQTFPFDTPQEAYAAWHKHLALTGANEVDRLRAREAAALAIVRDVASVPDAEYVEECVFCREQPGYTNIKHTPDCPVTQARALLGKSE